MAVYDVAAHPILTPKANALVAEGRFSAHVLLAETLLGVSGPAYTDADLLEKARLAVALQVNFQAEQGIDPLVYESVSSGHSSQSAVYRDRYLDPRAAAIWHSTLSVEQLSGRYGEGITSHRRSPEKYYGVRRLR